MKRIFIAVVALSIITFIAIQRKQAPEPAADPGSLPGPTAQPAPISPSAQRPKVSGSQTTGAAVRPDLSQESLVVQARAMNRIFPNRQAAEAEQKRLEALAASLTDSERSYLVEKVTSAETGDNIRALSLYLLTLAPSTTPENLKAIALMPNPVAGRPLAEHSPEEWQDRTAKAFATGAVGELRKRLQQDPSIARDLQEISQRAPMPIVKKMARNYLREAESREPASVKGKKK